MDINVIAGREIVPKSSMKASRDYVNEVTTEDKQKTQLEEIRDENRGSKVDIKA